jgi:hypothetical protein
MEETDLNPCLQGMNISLGAEVFIGTGATILDTCPGKRLSDCG